nr:collagen alpha-2(I) chain-like [Oryctolagus cuniculus]
MPGALLLSASGSNGQRRARQKPGGLTSIQGAQEAGRRGPWVTGCRGRTASGPGASDAGRGRQRAGASRGATAAARGECACARRCAPEVAPCAPEVAPRGPRRSGRSPRGSRPLLPESPREPSEPSWTLPAEPAGDPAPPGSGRAQRGCGPRLPRRFPGAVLFFGPSWKQRPSRASVPPADRAPLAVHLLLSHPQMEVCSSSVPAQKPVQVLRSRPRCCWRSLSETQCLRGQA